MLILNQKHQLPRSSHGTHLPVFLLLGFGGQLAYSRLHSLQRVIQDVPLLEVEVLPSQLHHSEPTSPLSHPFRSSPKFSFPSSSVWLMTSCQQMQINEEKLKGSIQLWGVLWLTALKDSKHGTTNSDLTIRIFFQPDWQIFSP